MITLYVTYGNNLVMDDELFAPIGILERNREEFNEQTKNSFFVVDEYVYQLLCNKNHTEYNDRMIIASENLFKKQKGPTDHDWEVHIDTIPIVSGYQQAVPKALEQNREVTILLCGADMMQYAVRSVRNIDRLMQVTVATEGGNGPVFPDITSHFRFAYKKSWPQDKQNPYEAVLSVYLANAS